MACDGFILAERTVKIEPEEAEPILVYAEDLLNAQRILPKKEVILETQDDKTAIIKSVVNHEIPAFSIHIPLAPHNYPAYLQIKPQEKTIAHITLGPYFIKLLPKLFDRELGSFTQFKIRSATSPVEIINGNTTIYLMPIAMEEQK